MKFNDIKVLYLRELRSAMRARSILVNGILIPILLYPLLIWLIYTGVAFVSGQNESLKSRVMLNNLPGAHQDLQKRFESDSAIELQMSSHPLEDIRKGTLDAFIEFSPKASGNSELFENFVMKITFDGSRDRSQSAKERAEEKVTAYRNVFLQRQAVHAGLTKEQYQGFRIEEENVSSDRQMGQFVMGLLLPMILIIMLAIGSFYPAIDSTAGERENSTWETIMTAATSRSNIVVAKYLYVATMSFVAGLLNLSAMIFSMRAILAPLGKSRMGNMTFEIPWTSLPVIIAGAVLLALFIAAVMMTLASFARTFKEGQSLVSPFYVAIIIPVSFLQGPGQEFTSKSALIPVVNVVLMFREAITGKYQWPLIAITLAVEAACVFLALRLAMSVLRHEDIVTGSYSGTFGKFFRERIWNGGRK